MEILTGFCQPYNDFISTFGIHHYHTDLLDYFVIEELQENKGMSITNGAEFFCVQIAERYNVDFRRCRFIEYYPAENLPKSNDAMSLINFVPGEIHEHIGFRVATLKGWRPISLDFAEILSGMGLVLPENIGEINGKV